MPVLCVVVATGGRCRGRYAASRLDRASHDPAPTGYAIRGRGQDKAAAACKVKAPRLLRVQLLQISANPPASTRVGREPLMQGTGRWQLHGARWWRLGPSAPWGTPTPTPVAARPRPQHPFGPSPLSSCLVLSCPSPATVQPSTRVAAASPWCPSPPYRAPSRAWA